MINIAREIDCYILDDEESAVNSVKRLVERTPGLRLRGTATNPYKGLEEIQDTDYLIFLDISLGGINGINLAQNLANKIIFMTAHEEYALDSFDNENTIDYIVKPVSYHRFLQAVRKANAFINGPVDTAVDYDILKLKIDGRVVRISMDSIDYVEAAGNYSYVHYGDKKTLASMNLSNLEPMLPSDIFCRIHKSSVVNRNKIRTIHGEHVFLLDGTILKVGRTYKMNLK